MNRLHGVSLNVWWFFPDRFSAGKLLPRTERRRLSGGGKLARREILLPRCAKDYQPQIDTDETQMGGAA
jgi:hypothetical protein